MQSQRPPRVAEPPPHPYGLAGWLGGKRGRGRPAVGPCAPHGQDPVHRCLLKHNLADEDRPRAHSRVSPGKIPGAHAVPVKDGVRERGRCGCCFRDWEPTVKDVITTILA